VNNSSNYSIYALRKYPDGTLGLILAVIGLGFDLVYSLIGKEIAAFTASHKGMQKMQNRVVAGLLALIGLKVGLA